MTKFEIKTGVGPEEMFWKGPDIRTAGQVTLNLGGGFLPIIVTSLNIPQPLHPMAAHLDISVRSRFAQVGIDIDDDEAIMAIAIKLLQQKSAPFVIEIPVFHHGTRPVTIPKDTGVFRLFSYPKEKALEGDGLTRLIGEGAIQIGGIKEEDWMWAWEGNNLVGIDLHIDSRNRKWIPPHPEDEPLVINGVSHDYRREHDELFREVPLTDKPIFWVGETPAITLDNCLDAVLDEEVFSLLGQQAIKVELARQINSRLIDGGKTRWAIRVEIVSPTADGLAPQFVRLRLFRKTV